MKGLFFLMIITFLLNKAFGFLFCPKSNKAPKKIDINSSYTINPIIYNNESYSTIQIGKKIFLNRFKGDISMMTTGYYEDSEFCPKGFKIPLKEDYESLIKQLGKNAYSVFTDPNGFNMEPRTYYITNTKGNSQFSKIMLYLDGNSIKFTDDADGRMACRCMLDIYSLKLNYTNNTGEINRNQKTVITIDSNNLNGYLWKIGDNIFTTKSIEYTFRNSGRHPIEFWGNLINGETIYYCDYIFVKKPTVSSSQQFDNPKIKIIETDFKMSYNPWILLIYSNTPVAPRIDGGYYISFSDEEKNLHVLSYDKDDNLIKDFNTTEKAYPFDITATDYGFAIYVLDASDTNKHSYLSLYNKKFELINRIQIMNNGGRNTSIVSNINYQVIRYYEDGTPVNGMRFMDKPLGGKLAYSRGIIFLIFAHYNYLPRSGHHEGDSIVTFDDVLQDMNFGNDWGTSHSLIQSATFDNEYFWTASLGDGYPEGITVMYTSKTNISNDLYNYDPINKKYNLRYYGGLRNLAGYIKGDQNGHADGKLGGILYFEKYNLHCLIYAKTPNHSSDGKDGKNIIYITTWNFDSKNEAFLNNKTIEVKIFQNETLMNVKGGKYGDDKVFIIYSFKTIYSKDFGWGHVDMGTISYLSIYDISTSKIIKDGVKMDKFIMNTNEDIKTFNDGVLIWASTTEEGKLIIHKIGTPLLNETYDDINYILSKDDLNKRKENNSFLTTKVKIIILITFIILILLLGFAIYKLIRCLCFKKEVEDINCLAEDKLVN